MKEPSDASEEGLASPRGLETHLVIIHPVLSDEPSSVGELLWEVHVNHVFWRAELFDEQAYGFDVRLFRDAELLGSHRWANREAAIAWANEQRGHVEKGWAE